MGDLDAQLKAECPWLYEVCTSPSPLSGTAAMHQTVALRCDTPANTVGVAADVHRWFSLATEDFWSRGEAGHNRKQVGLVRLVAVAHVLRAAAELGLLALDDSVQQKKTAFTSSTGPGITNTTADNEVPVEAMGAWCGVVRGAALDVLAPGVVKRLLDGAAGRLGSAAVPSSSATSSRAVLEVDECRRMWSSVRQVAVAVGAAVCRDVCDEALAGHTCRGACDAAKQYPDAPLVAGMAALLSTTTTDRHSACDGAAHRRRRALRTLLLNATAFPGLADGATILEGIAIHAVSVVGVEAVSMTSTSSATTALQLLRDALRLVAASEEKRSALLLRAAGVDEPAVGVAVQHAAAMELLWGLTVGGLRALQAALRRVDVVGPRLPLDASARHALRVVQRDASQRAVAINGEAPSVVYLEHHAWPYACLLGGTIHGTSFPGTTPRFADDGCPIDVTAVASSANGSVGTAARVERGAVVVTSLRVLIKPRALGRRNRGHER